MWDLRDAIEESNRQDEIMEEAEIWADMLMEEKKKAAEQKAKQAPYSSSYSSSYTPKHYESSKTVPSEPEKKAHSDKKPKYKEKKTNTVLYKGLSIFSLIIAIFCLMLTIAGISLIHDASSIAAAIFFALATAGFTALWRNLKKKAIPSKSKNQTTKKDYEKIFSEPAPEKKIQPKTDEPKPSAKKEIDEPIEKKPLEVAKMEKPVVSELEKKREKNKNDDVSFYVNGKEFKHPGYSALNPDYKYRLIAKDGKTYHTHLGCYLNWSEEYKKNFSHWDVITIDETKEKGLKECKFCAEREKLFAKRRNEILLSGEEYIEELRNNHTFEEYKITKSSSASCQEVIDSLSVGDELKLEEDEDFNYQVKYNDEVIGYVPDQVLEKIRKGIDAIKDECILEEELNSYVSEIIVSPSTGKYSVKIITLIEDPLTLDRILLNIKEKPELHYEEDIWY